VRGFIAFESAHVVSHGPSPARRACPAVSRRLQRSSAAYAQNPPRGCAPADVDVGESGALRRIDTASRAGVVVVAVGGSCKAWGAVHEELKKVHGLCEVKGGNTGCLFRHVFI